MPKIGIIWPENLLNMYQILLFYKYTPIEDPQALANEQRALCQRLNLKCRSIIAKEGVNVTLEGKTENTEEYIRIMKADPRFTDIHFKKSPGTGNAFPKVSIKVRDEIVSLGLGENDFSPTQVTGKYLQTEELHDWFKSKKEFYIVDMRNDYEHAVGRFAGSILPKLGNFRDLPEVLPELESLKNKTVLTVCTGGVRCEKASGFLVKNGFNDVYQLFGGIVTYMEKYPNEDFHGLLYVFDGRVTMGFNVTDSNHVVVGECKLCQAKTENYIDCKYIHCRGHRHILCCDNCEKTQGGYCSNACKKAANPKTSFWKVLVRKFI